MKIVRVQYTTREDFAERNRKNINAVVDELKKLNHPGIKYSTYILDDGKTFMHFDQFADEAAHELLQELESFKIFAAELDASEMEVEPRLDLLTLAGSTERFF